MLEIPVIFLYSLLSKVLSFVWWGGASAQSRPSQSTPADVRTPESSVTVPDTKPQEASKEAKPQEPPKAPEKPAETPKPVVPELPKEPTPVLPQKEDAAQHPEGPLAESAGESSGDEFVKPSKPEVVDPDNLSQHDSDEGSPDIEELKISSFTGASGTVVEMPSWDVEGAAEKVYKACKGLGTTEADITEVVCSINNAQRQQLREKYLAMYGEDLMDRLKSELNSRFQDLIIGLMTPPDEYLADWLRWALQGAGTEEDTLIEVLCCRTNEEVERIKEAYKQKYERELEEDIESDLTGAFQKLIRAVLACGRDESGTVDRDLAKSDAQELLDAGAEQWGTDESKFNAVLCTRSYPHLREVFKAYADISGSDISEAIETEFSGDLKAGLLAIVAAVREPAAYYASKLNQALAGAGTRDNILIRIIVTRSEVDLKDIKDAYAANYEEPLADKVASDTRGDYEEALLKIIG